MNREQESRSRRGHFQRDFFDEMDAFDPATIEQELRRQAQSAISDKKNIFMKKFHYNSCGIPKRIKFEVEKEDSKFSSGASTVASSSTESTALSSHWSSNDYQLDESFDTTASQGRDFTERRPRSFSGNIHLGQPMSRKSSQRQAALQHHHEISAMRGPPPVAPLEQVRACSPQNETTAMSDCVRNRSSTSALTTSNIPGKNNLSPPRTPKYTDLPRGNGNKQRRHKDSRSTKSVQRASSLVLDRERTGASDRRRHIDDLFAGPTHAGRDSKCENPSKSHSYHNRSQRSPPPRPPRRTNSVDRGTHINSLFCPSGPEVKIAPTVRSHSKR